MRGALLIAAAVLLGAGLLANGFRDNHVSSSRTTPTTTRSTVPGGTASTVPQPHDPALVKVLVLNGSGKSGVAKTAADQLKAANYTTLEPSNVKSGGTLTASIVYFAPGFDADAQTIAAKLSLNASAAQPLPNPLPPTVSDAQGASIVVIIATDAPIAGGAGAGTTSSTAPTSTTAN
jgi:LytR cell envelope-related transcriptional attenuator